MVDLDLAGFLDFAGRRISGRAATLSFSHRASLPSRRFRHGEESLAVRAVYTKLNPA
jgi:hypothetical protein